MARDTGLTGFSGCNDLLMRPDVRLGNLYVRSGSCHGALVAFLNSLVHNFTPYLSTSMVTPIIERLYGPPLAMTPHK